MTKQQKTSEKKNHLNFIKSFWNRKISSKMKFSNSTLASLCVESLKLLCRIRNGSRGGAKKREKIVMKLLCVWNDCNLIKSFAFCHYNRTQLVHDFCRHANEEKILWESNAISSYAAQKVFPFLSVVAHIARKTMQNAQLCAATFRLLFHLVRSFFYLLRCVFSFCVLFFVCLLWKLLNFFHICENDVIVSW